MTTPTVPTHAPPAFLNVFMKAMLHTPGVQRLVGSSVGLITFEGRKTGKRYTTPVSYARSDETVTVLTKAARTWWRNFEANPHVRLRLAGEEMKGRARAHIGDDRDFETLSTFLEKRPVDAKAYGIELDADGRPAESDTRALLPQIVIVEIEID